MKYLSPRQGTLIFKNTQPSDTGEYQCLVEAIDNNSVVVSGSSLSSSPVHIKVLGKQRHIFGIYLFFSIAMLFIVFINFQAIDRLFLINS